MARRRVGPAREPGPLALVVGAVTLATGAYLLVAAACQVEPAIDPPDGSCRDRVIYQRAHLSDC